MRRLLGTLPLIVCLLHASGCAICCAPFDCDYPCIGGRWVRNNPSSGRVGSAFDEAGSPVETVATATAEEPTPAQPPAQQPTESLPAPRTRSLMPRNMGESYLP